MRNRARLCASAAIGALLLTSLACVRPLQVRYEQELEATPVPARHAVQSQRLRDAMRRLKLISVERLPKEMDVAAERRQRVEAVATLASEMAKSAEEIPGALAGVEISEPARREFLRLAGELRARSLALASEAPRLSLDDLEARWQHVEAACAECHSRYRILPRAP